MLYLYLFLTIFSLCSYISLDEWQQFCVSITSKLPSAYRLNGSLSRAHRIHTGITRIFTGPAAANDSKHIPIPIPWLPSSSSSSPIPRSQQPLGFHFSLSRQSLNKNSKTSISTNLKKLHQFLVDASGIGDLCRQEEVSMIPPHFLRPRSTDLVLDLCAAPGSKTAQLLSYQQRDAERLGLGSAEGGCIANDASFDRACLLRGYTTRGVLKTPASMVTCHPAQHFPLLPILRSHSLRERSECPWVRFDKVLCDVPCSGDGTMRKLGLAALHKWSLTDARALHHLQVAHTH